MIGSDQGNTYRGQESVDQAFSLNYKPDISRIDKSFELDAIRKKEQAEKQSQLGKWNQERPEFFWSHDAEKQFQMDALFQYGQELMAAGIDDPTTSTDPKAKNFQMEIAKIGNLGKMSKAVEANYEKDRSVVLSDKDGKYSDGSKVALMKWYETTTIDEIVSKGLIPPQLELKAPEIDAEKSTRDISTAVADDAPMENYYTIFSGKLGEDPGYVQEIEQTISTLPDEAKAILAANAKDANVDINTYYASTWAKSYKPGFDLKAALDGVKINIKPVSKSVKTERLESDGSAVSRSTKKEYVPLENLKAAAGNAIAGVPGLSEQMIKQKVEYDVLVRDPKTGVFSVKERKVVRTKEDAAEFLAHKEWPNTVYKQESGKDITKWGDNSGYGGDDAVRDDYDLWKEAITGNLGNTDEERRINQIRAADYMNGMKLQGYEIGAGTAAKTNGSGTFEHGASFDQGVENAQSTGFYSFTPGANGTLTLFGSRNGSKEGIPTLYNNDFIFDMNNPEQFNNGSAQQLYRGGLGVRKALFKESLEGEYDVEHTKIVESADDAPKKFDVPTGTENASKKIKEKQKTVNSVDDLDVEVD